ncbi:MAG: hypothetical protein N4A45_00645 [Flavobacteriales bacterium]|nr:hypothetical protein [Flavobacteriales bacterium]
MNKIRLIFIAMFMFSVAKTVAQEPTYTQVEYQSKKTFSFPFEHHNLEFRFPVVTHFIENRNNQSYVYAIRQTDPTWIDKFSYHNKQTIKVDSFIIPQEVFMENHQHIEEFLVIGKDSFLIQPSYEATNGAHVFFEFSKNHLKRYDLANNHNGKYFAISKTHINPISYANHTLVGRISHLDGLLDMHTIVDTMCTYPALVKLNLKDGSIHFFDEYDEVLCQRKIEAPFVHFKERLFKGDSLITLSPFTPEFHIFSDETGAYSKKSFDFKDFDEHFYHLNNMRKELTVNDYFFSMVFNPFTHKFYVLMLEGLAYNETDDFIASPVQQRKYTVLIFDEALNLEGSYKMSEHLSMQFEGRLIPSPNGFYLRKMIGDQYEIHEFKKP